MRCSVLASFLILFGCASQPPPAAQSQPEKLRPGDASAPASLRALPELSQDRSSQLQRGLSLAGQVFATPLPPAPADREYKQLAQWVDNEVVRWIDARREAVEETRFQLNSIDSEPAASVITSAVIGLLQEDTAYQLTLIPQPKELDNEPEIAEMFHELVRGQADPFQHAALSEYQKCAKTGDDEGGASLRFARFCRQRHDRLVRVDAKPTEAIASH